MKILSVLTSVFVGYAAASETITIGEGPVKVDFVGNSGQFKIYPSDGSDWMKLKWDKLVEVDVDGNKVQEGPALASQNFSYSTPKVVTIGNPPVSATKTTLSAVLEVGTEKNKQAVDMEIDTYLMGGKTTITTQGHNSTATVDVPAAKDSLKFAIRFGDAVKTDKSEKSGWPFKDTSNKLRVGVNIQQKSGSDQFSKDKGADDSSSIRFGKNKINSAGFGIFDGAIGPVKTYAGQAQGSSSISVEWTLPHFEDGADYDPDLQTVGSGSGVGNLQPTVFIWTLVSAVGLLATMWIGL